MSDENDLGISPADVAATRVDVEDPSPANGTAETEPTESMPSTLSGNQSEESFTEVKISDIDEPESADKKETEASDSESTLVAAPPTIVEPSGELGESPEPPEKNSPVESVPVTIPSVVEPTDEVEETPPDAPERRRPSQPSIQASELRDRELPPLPDPSPVTPRAGIPIAISTDRPISSNQLEPQAPLTPMRGSSRNAPTTTNQKKRFSSASLSTNNSAGQPTLSSMVFVVQALESIGASKDGKKRKPLGDSVQRALTAIKDAAPSLPPDPAVVFEPLQIACTVQNTQVITTALDCIGKLISYSYFSIVPTLPVPPSPSTAGTTDGERPQKLQQVEIPLIERAIETICDCFQGDATPDQVQLQIIKALLAAVLNDKAIVHGAGLLKAVRQTYNIFLLSRNSPNQMTAQGTLTQMVHTVFERVKIRISMKEANLAASNHGSESPITLNVPPSVEEASSHAGDAESQTGSSEIAANAGDNRSHEKITLQSFENRKSFDDERIADNAPTTVTRSARTHRHIEGGDPTLNGSTISSDEQDDEDEIFIKDAFLVFRAMCKLSIKTLPAEQIADLKSHGMRSKLLSLHLIHTILKSHMTVFVSPLSTIRSSSSAEATGFIHAVKQYLCLSLSRNAASAVGLVFEVCCEIFWLIISNMRVMLKVNIPTLFTLFYKYYTTG